MRTQVVDGLLADLLQDVRFLRVNSSMGREEGTKEASSNLAGNHKFFVARIIRNSFFSEDGSEILHIELIN